MPTIRLLPNRACILVPVPSDSPSPILRLDLSAGSNRSGVFLPYAPGIRYLLISQAGQALTCEAAGFECRNLGWFASALAKSLALAVRKRRKILTCLHFKVLALGALRARKTFSRVNALMARNGAALDGSLAEAFPELLLGWEGPRVRHSEARNLSPMPAPVAPGPVAIIVHLFYPDLWNELSIVLRRQQYRFDLYVTLAEGGGSAIGRVKADFPDAHISLVENRGRDILPFLRLLEGGILAKYAVICKIHGKKSAHSPEAIFAGAFWRRRMLFDLLAAQGAVERVFALFSGDPKIGMVGPRRYRYPNAAKSADDAWGFNRQAVLSLASRMGIAPEAYRLDYFAGTMFWVRPEALEPLAALKLSHEFPEERGATDAALEHAIERLLSASATVSGFTIADVDGVETAARLQSLNFG